MRKHTLSGGFTLIELLVVIAIIAILAAILFPVFSRARESARRSTCVNNLHQIYIAMAQYADDYKGFLPRPPEAITPDWKKQRKGMADMYSYFKVSGIMVCKNARKNDVNNGYCEIEIPRSDGSVEWARGSYHFWPQVYQQKVNNAWQPARMDVDLTDTTLYLHQAGFSAEAVKQAIDLGGPVADCLLHPMNDTPGGKGVLTLALTNGSVRFLPGSAYPWY